MINSNKIMEHGWGKSQQEGDKRFLPGLRNRVINQFWKQLVIWICILFALFPIVWVISAAFDPANSIAGQRLIPKNASLINFEKLFNSEQQPFLIWMYNSYKVAISNSFLVVCISSLAGYAFSRMRFRGRRTGLFGIILVQMFPQMLAMVAIYLIVFRIGQYIPALGLDTHAGLVLVYMGGSMGVNVWMIKNYFDTIPYSLEESAMLDGATPFQLFSRIILPLTTPILVVVFFLQFIGIYSEFILARVLLASNDKFTIAVGLQSFIADQYSKRWGVFSAAAIIGTVPVMILFWLLQKQLITGLTSGAVKN
ncbi:MAG TPA: maltose ABC transporter permease [Firmicutes bacterium]|jgi:ABC-type maltose transport system permease subunit|nr:maltose ABC transporter permease [Bacillota bacterium]HBT15671.1 maltose ABC transporter permease [Bacillota bacterium]